MQDVIGVRISAVIIAAFFALFATNAGAHSRTHVTRTLPIGTSGATGASIETEYIVSPNPAQTERSRQSALRRGRQGRYAFDEAITYLKRSPRAANIISRVENANSQLIVLVNDTCKDDQHIGASWSSVIDWDPHCAYRIAHDGNSPAMILLHELVHTLHLFEDPQTYLNALGRRNAQYSDDEERRTIFYGESPVEQQLGELVRYNHHDGTPFTVYDPTTR